MPTLLIFLKRKPGMSLADFRAHYEERHVPLCLRYMAGPTGYRRRHLDPPEGGAELDFDVVTELDFPEEAMTRSIMKAMARDALPADVIADEQRFLDRSRTRWALAETFHTSLESA